MFRKFRKAIILIAIWWLCGWGISSNASECDASEYKSDTLQVENDSSMITFDINYLNPIYEDKVEISEEFTETTCYSATLSTNTVPQFDNSEAVSEFINTRLILRETEITFQYETFCKDLKKEFRNIWDSAIAWGEKFNPKSGDYLRYQFLNYKLRVTYDEVPGVQGKFCCNATYYVTYFTDASQEQFVDKKVAEILDELKITEKTDYQKLRLIYDYVCSSIEYDYDNLSNMAYTKKYTVYGALAEKKAVCQGYALLLYRLCREVGLQIKIVTGIGNGELHAWNIVALDNEYYNVDSTWDAVIYRSNKKYKFFLKSAEEFEGHIRDEEYRTKYFDECYPMASTSYAYSGLGSECLETVKVELLEVKRDELSKSLSITWKKEENIDGYEIYRRMANTPNYVYVVTVADEEIEYIDKNLETGSNYYYQVRAFSEDDNGKKRYGEFSNIKGAKVIVPPPKFSVKGCFEGKEVTFYSEQDDVKIYYSMSKANITKDDICVKNGERIVFSTFNGYIYARAYDEKSDAWSSVARLMLNVSAVNPPTVTKTGNYVNVECSTPNSYLIFTMDGTTPSLVNGRRILKSEFRIFCSPKSKIKILGIRSCFDESLIVEVED